MNYKYKDFFFFLFSSNKIKLIQILFLSLLEAVLEVFSIAVLIGALTFALGQNNIGNEFIKIFIEHKFIQYSQIINLFYLVIFVYLLRNILLIFLNWLKLDLCGKIFKKISETTYETLLKKNYLFISNYTSGDLAQNVIGESQFTKDVIVSFVSLITQVLIIIFMFLLIFLQKPLIGFLTIIFIISASFIFYFFVKKTNIHLGEKRQRYSIEIMNLLFQSIAAHKLIVLRNKINFFLNKFSSKINEIYKISRDQTTIQYSSYLWLESCILLILVFSLTPLLNTANKPNEKISEIVLVAVISLRFIPSFSTILNSYSTIQFGQKAVLNILELLKNKNYNVEKDQSYNNNKINIDQLELRSVSFKYKESNNFILKDFNFSTKNNLLIGVKGKNGSGKSTLLNIISGLIKPQSGNLLLNGQSIYDEENIYFNWKKKIGYVDQNFFFTNESVLKNIGFGEEKEKIDVKKVEDCLQKVDLLTFFQSQPQGLNMLIGENGLKLSGGQLQRINIARALYSNPSILILDEATNNLDTDSQKKLLDLLITLKKTSLIFIATHSESLIKECDNIIYL